MNSETKEVVLKVCRYNPHTDETPYYKTYSVPVTQEKMNLLQALEYIYQKQDATLAFRRYCCGIQFCNSCVMLINGKRTHACLTVLSPQTELEVAPLPGTRVLRDLVFERR
jgi:succinate dehydrogenase / fumarate reductase iron-sulfur subunit